MVPHEMPMQRPVFSIEFRSNIYMLVSLKLYGQNLDLHDL